jgi:DNA-binding XRE family transcriptional regulator
LNIDDLRAEIARCGLTVPKLAEKIGMDKKTLYSRMKNETAFKQTEIVSISKMLNLTQDKIFSIFLADTNEMERK